MGKVLFIALLAGALLIPLGMIRGLTIERAQRYDAARHDVAQAWGNAQYLGGPVLIVPFRFTRMVNAAAVTVVDEVYVLPEELTFAATVDVEQLARGIYRVPVYTARLNATGRFAPPIIEGDYDNFEILWDEAQLALPISDARSLREPVRLQMGGGIAQFRPGGVRVAGFGPLLVTRLADLGLTAFDTDQAFSFDLVLGGTSALRFLPLAATTSVDLQSDWPSPRFGGAHLPAQRSVGDAGFSAQWRVLDLGRPFASSWRRSGQPPQAVEAAAFGVDLFTPIGVHEAALRAVKYAVLFLAFTFGAFFLYELFAALRLHPMQYLLVGCANCVFYLLLLALAEQIGFGPAYLASTLASIILIGGYSAAILGKIRRALPVVALLAALYGYLYVTLRAEDYALVFGALGVFAALAVFMYVTRRIEWYAVHFGAKEKTPEPPPAPSLQLHA